MGAWWIAILLACGCLSKPQPPLDQTTGDSGMPGPPCMSVPSLAEPFDDTNMGCGPRMIAFGSGTATRMNGALVFDVQGDADYMYCETGEFMFDQPVFVEVRSASFTQDDLTYLGVFSNPAFGAFVGVGVKNGNLETIVSLAPWRTPVPFNSAATWWRLTSVDIHTIRIDTSIDGKQWTTFDMITNDIIDTTVPVKVDFGILASPTTGARSSVFDNFDVCPP